MPNGKFAKNAKKMSDSQSPTAKSPSLSSTRGKVSKNDNDFLHFDGVGCYQSLLKLRVRSDVVSHCVLVYLVTLMTRVALDQFVIPVGIHDTFRNKQGQTRYSSYYEWISMEERSALESEIIRKCLSRSELQCSFLEYRGYKVIYRRYASLFFIVGTKPDVGAGDENCENEMGMLEFIHTLVETMDKWAGSICEVSGMSGCQAKRKRGTKKQC